MMESTISHRALRGTPYTLVRFGPGSYEVRDPEASVADRVIVTRVTSPEGFVWIAAAGWDNYLYSDPHYTLADALDEAVYQLMHYSALDCII